MTKLRVKNEIDRLLTIDVNIKKIHGLLNYDGTSCYSDCVLFSLLAIPDNFIHNYMLCCDIKHNNNISKNCEKIRNIIQKYILKICISIRHTNNIKSCDHFKKLLKLCRIDGMPNFGKSGQQEAGEFLIYLFTIFNINNIAKTKNINFVTNNISSSVTKKELIQTSIIHDRKASPVIFIDPFLLINKSDKNNLIYYFLKQFTDSGLLSNDNLFKLEKNNKVEYYRRKFSYMTIIDSPYIVFWVQRANPVDSSVIYTRITPTQKITLKSNRILYLNSIIIHMGSVNGGHYVTFFRKDKKWYLYDDINPNIIYIGNYFKMLHTNPNPCTNGVLYFYS